MFYNVGGQWVLTPLLRTMLAARKTKQVWWREIGWVLHAHLPGAQRLQVPGAHCGSLRGEQGLPLVAAGYGDGEKKGKGRGAASLGLRSSPCSQSINSHDEEDVQSLLSRCSGLCQAIKMQQCTSSNEDTIAVRAAWAPS